ncbi:MAG: Rsd/AlgQ family anti-sigma factor [Nitrincola lacisaponensis]|uniref:Regulator of sigma D n=1 Tax=Nitrincola lacisaponensis TaxID=267850 RepID=A0A063Y430_9GAMM|nr:Rsd/AlgQ family anti-sigma factor [Nitrincola lacisaponensis]KDE41068.1 Regulator of sigma D [Nitrincola lacisaponensis]
MLEKCRNARERWGGVSQIIDLWLEQRQQLISCFISLPETEVGEPLNSRLDTFCSLLIDYISSGHFEVYEQLLNEGNEFQDGSVEQAQKLLPRIQPTTDFALDFNDTCQGFSQPTLQELRDFSNQLSRLGEMLEERFSIEDQLIEILHTAHTEQANSIA